jgi:hypothetical protein
MALAVPTLYTSNNGSDATIVCDKPTGLAVGDLMIAHYGSNGSTTVSLTGWTSIRTTTTGSGKTQQTLWKVATSGDVSAADFTFTVSVGGSFQRIALTRIPSTKRNDPIGAENGQANSSATVTSPAVTPDFANSLIGLFTMNIGSSAVSTYAIATSSPTFTELYDLSGAGAIGISAAFGVRAAATSTGSGTATLDGGSFGNAGHIISISPEQEITVTESVTMSETVSVLRTLNLTVSESISLVENFALSKYRAWVNAAKNISTWISEDK